MARKLVYGVGINDANYEVATIVDGKKINDKYYACWQSMLSRCYSENYHAKKPTYKDCRASDEWLRFSNFRAWMIQQDWEGKELDKDLLFIGNKLYSAETCVFVDRATNQFITDAKSARGLWPRGVTYEKKTGEFQARCSNPFTKKHEHLGRFNCPRLAHYAWRAKKHEHALKIADMQTDARVAEVLRKRYAM